MICKNLSVNNDGHLTLSGVDVVELAQKYGNTKDIKQVLAPPPTGM